jgi:hypothetical protein
MRNHMKTPGNTRALRRIVIALAYVAAISAGLKYGYDFGAQISGRLLGVVLAINGAVFCSLIVGMVTDRFARVTDEPDRQP